MRFLVVVPDGSADNPIDSLGGRTPLEVALLPCIDGLASRGIVGTCRTVPLGISPGSDSANLSVMGLSLIHIFCADKSIIRNHFERHAVFICT